MYPVKFIQNINFPLIPNLYGVKCASTKKCNIKFCSFVDPVPINGMQAEPPPLLPVCSFEMKCRSSE